MFSASVCINSLNPIFLLSFHYSFIYLIQVRCFTPKISCCLFQHILIFNYFLPRYITTSSPCSWVISSLTCPNVCFNFNISYVFYFSHGKILKHDALVSYKSSPLASSSSLPLLPLRWYLVIRILFSCDSTCFVYFSHYGYWWLWWCCS